MVFPLLFFPLLLPPLSTWEALGNRGDTESVLDRLGLRSSSERDKLMGSVVVVVLLCCDCWRVKELLLGVAGVGAEMLLLLFLLLLSNEVEEPAEDHAGTGGLLILGETAIFLDGCWEEDEYGDEEEGVGQSPDCCICELH